MGYKVAVAGATGNVGQEILKILAERNFPADEVVPLASSNSIGKEVSYGEDTVLKCRDLATYDFTGTDIALFSPGAKVSAEHAPRAAKAGCVVVDNTSHFRMEPDVPLVVPEVNRAALKGFRKRNIIANPNCSTIQMVMALKPLHELATLTRVCVATYQSVSGGGREKMDELFEQTKKIYLNEPVEPEQFSKQIAFNAIPHIDSFMDDGTTKEEWKMTAETAKILDPDIQVQPFCVRLPIFISHGEAIFAEFAQPVAEEDAYEALRSFPGVAVFDKREDGCYVTPVEAAGEDSVFISRLRRDKTAENGLTFWCVGDNIRKGAALNTVQIAEELAADYLST